jgi:ribosomal protein S18 acetylase RimI-like enzyme
MAEMILTNPTQEQLAAAVHENLYALFRTMQALPESEVVEGDSLCFHYAPLPNPMFRGIWRARLEAEDTDAGIDEALAWFEQRQAPDFFWWTDAHTRPADLSERLARRGFDGNPGGDPGMAAELTTLNEAVETPEGFSIVRADGPETLKAWQEVFCAAFGMPASGGQSWTDAWTQTGGERSPWRLYLGFLDGRPVATSFLFMGAGTAGIYGVGVLPEARRLGLGAAVTLHPLLEARREGYRFGVLFSSRAGYKVYQRLGFRDVANPIGVYVWERAGG